MSFTGKAIKVQIIGGMSTKSVIESGSDAIKNPLTFHAFSDTMKARILESFIAAAPGKIAISFLKEGESAKEGEWHEPLDSDAFIGDFA